MGADHSVRLCAFVCVQGRALALQGGASRVALQWHMPVLPLFGSPSPAVPSLAAAESHTLRTSSKPPDALHTEAVTAALRLCRRAIMLTGTPSLSRPFDLFRQVGSASRACPRWAHQGPL